ncbi:hypothetical protein QQ045_003947 [Rhodiola kirilowii]
MSVASTASEQSGGGAVDGLVNDVLKSGPLFISSKGLGWKSWKKRWFILTNTSLVFFKSDPSIIDHGDGEVNLSLGGIDLNNSGSVIVREDKKLLTILFPDGQDGRGFTLKTETSEDLHEWRAALEHAFAQAPCTSVIMKSGTIVDDVTDGSFYRWKDKHKPKSRVMGNPISLSLQEVDGGPSLLEKALCFLEDFGTKVEGILRINADVEEVQRRIQEFEQGKTEFDANEDAHVVGDCVKQIIRELPTSLVPVCCCNELLKAFEIDQYEAQIKAFRVAILKNLPTPNQLLFQRILKMMYTISCTPENHMTPSAVAACMAPLLLQPILAGECNLADDAEFTDDDSAQFLAAAYAARTAQAIITFVLEEYHYIFSDENSNSGSISAGSEKDKGNEESTCAHTMKKKNIGNLDARSIINGGKNENPEPIFNEEMSRSSMYGGSDLYDNMDFSRNLDVVSGSFNLSSSESQLAECKSNESQLEVSNFKPNTKTLSPQQNQSTGQIYYSLRPKLSSLEDESCVEKSTSQLASPFNRKTSSHLEKPSQVKKICSTESQGSPAVKKLDVRQLEMKINDLQQRLAKEAKVNELLQASLEKRKQALLERRSILHQDVEKLHQQLQAERDLRLAVEVGLSQNMLPGKLSNQDYMTRAEQEEIAIAEADIVRLKQKVTALHRQLSQQQDLYGFPNDVPYQSQHVQNAKPLHRSLQQDFDATLASVNLERTQKTHGISSRSNRRIVGGIQSATTTTHYMDRRELATSTSIRNSESREVQCNRIHNLHRTPDSSSSSPYRDFKVRVVRHTVMSDKSFQIFVCHLIYLVADSLDILHSQLNLSIFNYHLHCNISRSVP